MEEIDFKTRQLRKYAHHLKTQLKIYSGESVKKGDSIERKLSIYKKLRKLFHYLDEKKGEDGIIIKDDKTNKQVKTYYDLLKGKIDKLNSKILEEKKVKNLSNLKKIQIDSSNSKIYENEIINSDEENEPNSNNRNNNNDLNDNLDQDNEYDEEFTEIGPTPQLNGRVLTIFDIETSPEHLIISPIKNRIQNNLNINLGNENNEDDDNNDDDKIFKTPSKPILSHDNNSNIIIHNNLSSSSRKLNFENIETTPIKNKINLEQELKINETPRYLRSQLMSIKNVDEIIIGDNWSEDEFDDGDDEEKFYADDDDEEGDLDIDRLPDIDDDIKISSFIEPSPIIKKRGRSLFDLQKDLIGLKRNLTDLEEVIEDDYAGDYDDNNNNNDDILEINNDKPNNDGFKKNENNDLNDENKDEKEEETIENVFDPHYKLRNKIKTIKRSTKRAKLKTDKIDVKDELEKVDIHALAFGNLSNVLDMGLNVKNHSYDDKEEEEEEEEYIRKDIKQLEEELNIGKSKGKGRHPLSNNFVRLKINRGGRKGGKFGRKR
ncbi:hypothetical protein C6P40_004543 [Pichia californica]|uniref:DNA replication regulator SLD2 n=1 Tax=Pichia californica TaxID=460514 RepID=A0A9P6WMN7_9ASCO|nr:hypothetical protein C6P42_005000 [[Candida] californica]KAG0689741.1 hypothetical protein C6P40_004543 [[Candida] californica]